MGNYLGNIEDDTSSTCRRKRLSDLKDAVLCMGCLRFFISSFAYLGIIVLLNCYSSGYWPFLLKILLAIIIAPELILAAILFVGALKDYDEEEQGFKKKALRDLVFCVANIRLVIVLYYVGLFFLVQFYATGTWNTALKFFIVLAIFITISCALILYYGALNEKIWALEISIWLCLAIAAYNIVLGVLGLLYFIREGKKTMHFVTAAFFGLLAMSFFAVIFHDVVIIHTLKKTISFSPVIPDLMYECC